ncbi:MAG: flavodoxin-dependent (E)-4-hydroxy-3-methylbut-2-enyl-diphosphate synthase, partial [Bacteroidota bacterium]|nr:flavodoxin-dependent (E)-4-hydroxy-3-methylbut-2-enyl-diphosphate synthase [Bacteroidota bacterium]
MENSLNNQGSKSESGEAFQYKRFITREVNIGGIPLGGINPVRIQTMTNTPTIDTAATVEQTIRCVRAGAEYVRITVPTIKEAENLFN